MWILRSIQRRANNSLKSCALLLFIGTAAHSARASVFVVTNTNDSGAGSLRQAILDANGKSGLDTIQFDIPGTGVQTITPATFLPFVTDPVVLDGETQPGASANTLANGDNAVLLIEINGATVSNNGNGLVLLAGASGSTIRGLVIDNGWSAAILIQTDTVAVEGCFLGTDPTGAIARGNTHGVLADFAAPTSGMRVGGTTPAARNVISGNATGISILSGSNHVVQGNFIGTDATGTSALGQQNTGIDVSFSSDNQIGGATVGARNIISGPGAISGPTGISVNAATGNQILGNFIGTDVTGTKALGWGHGITVEGSASSTVIGGPTSTAGTPPGNVLSGNTGGMIGIVNDNGIDVVGSNNFIQGNLIGMDASGTTALGNGNGIHVTGASNVIGGLDVMARNVISANRFNGIILGADNTVHDNLVQGNFIGTDISGTQLLGNGGDGVSVVDSTNNTIGGVVLTAGAPPGNLIAGNGSRGVGVSTVFGVTGLAIRGNSIFSNGGLGIDLNLDGVTLNDSGDADTGPNNLQNFPVITSVADSGGSVNIIGTLDSLASATYHLEFFGNDKVDPSHFGEGQSFLGSTDVTTNASGSASFDVTFPIAAGQKVTATATDADGNTSEFSRALIPKLQNISTRLRVLTEDNVLIGGFIITGTTPKNVIVRAIGPSLSGLGVPGALEDPVLELHETVGAVDTIIASNDNWKSDQQAEIEATGLPPTDDLESAIVATLAPVDPSVAGSGAYTAIVRGIAGGTGVALVEVYDLDDPLSITSELANISTRGFVDTGDNVMIGGFIVGPTGVENATVVVRAIGPSLESAGVTGALQDPTLELHDSDGAIIASNDNWMDSPDKQTIIDDNLAPTNDKESALLATLAPGAYTAIVRGALDTTGVGLVEVYNLD